MVPDDNTRAYGDVNPPFTLTYLGLTNSETPAVVDTLPIGSTTATTNSPVNRYPITASGGSDNNYSFLYRTGALTVFRAALLVSGTNGSRPFGQAMKNFGSKEMPPFGLASSFTIQPSNPPS